MGSAETLCSQDAVIVVDVQNDFFPGGALGIDGGDAIVPVLNDWLAKAARQGALTIASRDWSPVAQGLHVTPSGVDLGDISNRTTTLTERLLQKLGGHF